MIDYNGQVLPLCPWPAVHFSSPTLLNLKLNDRRVKWPCIRLCWTAARRPTGKGRYSYQTRASLVGMVYRRHLTLCTALHLSTCWWTRFTSHDLYVQLVGLLPIRLNVCLFVFVLQRRMVVTPDYLCFDCIIFKNKNKINEDINTTVSVSILPCFRSKAYSLLIIAHERM